MTNPKRTTNNAGFTLIELLVAAAVFMFVVSGVAGLFTTALDIQRRATGMQRIEENAQYVLETIAREIRVSTVTSGDTDCSSGSTPANQRLVIKHPVNGTVTYDYNTTSGIGVITRNSQSLTSSDVNVTEFAFCVSGSSADGKQTRVTIPMTLQSVAGRPTTRVSVSLQTTITSRDLTADLVP